MEITTNSVKEILGALPIKELGNIAFREAAKRNLKISVLGKEINLAEWHDRFTASDLEKDFNLALAQTATEMGKAEPKHKILYQKMTDSHDLRQDWIKIVFVQENEFQKIISQKINLDVQERNVLLRFAQKLRKNLHGKMSFQSLFAQQETFEIMGRMELNLEKIALFSEDHILLFEQNNEQNESMIAFLRQIAENTTPTKNLNASEMMNTITDFETWKLDLLDMIGRDEIRKLIEEIRHKSETYSQANKMAILHSAQFTSFEQNINILGIDAVKQDVAYRKFVGLQVQPFVEGLKPEDMRK